MIELGYTLSSEEFPPLDLVAHGCILYETGRRLERGIAASDVEWFADGLKQRYRLIVQRGADYDEDAPVSKMGRIKKPIARICDWCDEPFKTHFPSLKVCSTKCGRAKRIAYSAEYYAKGTPRKRRKNRKAREFVGRVREYVRQQKRDAA